MSKVLIPISERSRKYGYLYWTRTLDDVMENLLHGATSVNLVFEKSEHGRKNMDWKNRRISIGWRWTRLLPAAMSNFVLVFEPKDTLKVVCR